MRPPSASMRPLTYDFTRPAPPTAPDGPNQTPVDGNQANTKLMPRAFTQEAISNVESATYGRKIRFGVIWPQSQTKSQSASRSASQRHTSHTHVTHRCGKAWALLCMPKEHAHSRRVSSRPGPSFNRSADSPLTPSSALLRLVALGQGAEGLHVKFRRQLLVGHDRHVDIAAREQVSCDPPHVHRGEHDGIVPGAASARARAISFINGWTASSVRFM